MAEEHGGERTELATGKRREQARERGQVARSVEVTSAALLIVGVIVLVGSAGHFSRVLGDNAIYLLSQAHVLNPANQFGLQEMFSANLRLLLVSLAPLVMAVLIAAVAANVAQVGFNFSTKAISFQTAKLNPITGSKRFFQATMWFDLAKNLFKIIVITLLAWVTIRSLMGPFDLDIHAHDTVHRGGGEDQFPEADGQTSGIHVPDRAGRLVLAAPPARRKPENEQVRGPQGTQGHRG